MVRHALFVTKDHLPTYLSWPDPLSHSTVLSIQRWGSLPHRCELLCVKALAAGHYAVLLFLDTLTLS